MKKFTFSFKSLLIAAGLLIGSANAWGYDVPTGYEVKNVFIGTDNGDNTVTAEDYATTVATGWSLLSGATPDKDPFASEGAREESGIRSQESGFVLFAGIAVFPVSAGDV